MLKNILILFTHLKAKNKKSPFGNSGTFSLKYNQRTKPISPKKEQNSYFDTAVLIALSSSGLSSL